MSQPATTIRLWRAAGALAIAYVVLSFAAVAFITTPEIGSTPKAISSGLMTSSMTKDFTGGYLEFIAALVLLASLLLFARLLRGATEVSAWLASCLAATAVTLTAVGIAAGGAAGGAALYDGHHGASITTVATINDIRNFGFFFAVALDGVVALCIAGAVQVTRLLPRWVAYTGYVVGTLSIVSVIGARNGAHNLANMLFFIWLVAMAVRSMRQGHRAVAVAPRTAVANA
jgi:hypothetical protein